MASKKAPKEIVALVERFTSNIEQYTSTKYNEAQTRKEFIDPFFRSLGWDVANGNGYAEAYKDVIHEDALKVEGRSKAPDYSFRIGGVRKFFVEAKKPSINILEDEHASFQLRRYAWSASLPVSVLTNFKHLCLYDCRYRPQIEDKPTTARIVVFSFDEYVDKWNEIVSILSKESILKGSFDKFIHTAKSKRGTARVDNEFLKEIEGWREALSINIIKNRPSLSESELNYIVQRTVDRIIFLRMTEDRNIEPYGQLEVISAKDRVYNRLLQIYKGADKRYNSGLFHFRPEKDRITNHDELSFGIQIDDDVLRPILKNLYYPTSPYEFSVLPLDILGGVYERFLGKAIRLIGQNVTVEEKPEVQRSGGVYYTPTYVSQQMVKECLAPLTKNKTPDDLLKLRIIDPSCGSGSFLVEVYANLLEAHRTWYIENEPALFPTKVRETSTGDWTLTLEEKKKILCASVYGVDLDIQAVEVAKLSLLLKVLDDESTETIDSNLRTLGQKALPDLGLNIRCGNSLIESDFCAPGKSVARDDWFDWSVEFSEIMGQGGFDAVIGNPPYIFARDLISEEEKTYYSEKYKTTQDKPNTYTLFMELMVRILKSAGRGAFIVPNSWLTIESGREIRKLLIPMIDTIIDMNYQVFEKASMEPSIFYISKKTVKHAVALRVDSKQRFLEATPIPVQKKDWTSKTNELSRITFGVALEKAGESVLDKILSRAKPVGSVFEVKSGLQAYEKGKGTPRQTAADVKDHVFDCSRKVDSSTHKYLEGKDVARYLVTWSGGWMKHGPWLSQPRDIEIFSRPRVLVREITAKPPRCIHAAFSDKRQLNNKSILNVLHNNDSIEELLILAAVLNSRVASIYYKEKGVKSGRKLFPKVVIKNLREFPFPRVIESKAKNQVPQLVLQRIEAAQEVAASKTDIDRRRASKKAELLDKYIDDAVLKLFGLDDGDSHEIDRILEAHGSRAA